MDRGTRILVLSARALAALRLLPEGCAAVICCQTLPELIRHPGLQVLHIPFGDVTDPARPDAFREAYGRRIREFADRVPAGGFTAAATAANPAPLRWLRH